MSIKVFSVDTTGINDLRTLTLGYYRALAGGKKNRVKADRIQRVLEARAAQSIGAKLVQGKLGKEVASDFVVDEQSSIIKAFGPSDSSFIEFKAAAGVSKGSKVGQLTVKAGKTLFIQGEQEAIDAASVLENVFGKRAAAKRESDFLVDLDPLLQGKNNVDVTDRVFNFYFKKDKRLKKIFYAKSNIMLLNNKYNINGQTGTRLVGLNIPESYFNSKFFKARLEDKAIVISINNSFQKNIFEAINRAYMDQLKQETSKPKKVRITGAKKAGTYIDVLNVYEGTQFFGAEVTNSIAVRPSGAGIVSARRKKEDKPDKDFPSLIDITALVQGRTKMRMRRGSGDARPPKIHERTGTFRSSIQAVADFRTNNINYSYIPYYDKLEDYGYEVEDLVEGSIRAIAQKYFNRQFNLVKTNL